jgi:hypothetical protein
MKWLLFVSAVVLGLLLTGCGKDVSVQSETGAIKIEFSHIAGAEPFALNTSYTNAFGETFVVNKYKYYVSNITLTDERDAKHLVPETYFLVDESQSASKTLFVEAPIGTYKAISFLIGVDSIRNVSGAQTGVLDPFHDMFWTWNTGYVMAKLEGTSPQSNLPNQKIEYHTGGFKGEHSVLRIVTLPFDQIYAVQKLAYLQLNVSADVLKWFEGVHNLTIADAPTATAPGSLASRYADNYARMFTLTSVQQR